MENSKKVGIGFICPHFPVNVSLAFLSDGKEKAAISIQGNSDDVLRGYVHIVENVAKLAYGNAKGETYTEKAKNVCDLIGELTSVATAKALAEIKDEEEEK